MGWMKRCHGAQLSDFNRFDSRIEPQLAIETFGFIWFNSEAWFRRVSASPAHDPIRAEAAPGPGPCHPPIPESCSPAAE
eukprot:759696-Hanusia_phi.AAC.1